MNKADAFELAAKQGWLSDQPEDFRTSLLNRCTVHSKESGRTVFEAGDANSAMFGIVEGAVTIWWDHPQLSRRLVHVARPGIWFGEGVAYGVAHRELSARTKTKTTLLRISRQKLDELIAENPRRLANFGRLSMLHLQECLRMLGELMHQDTLIKVSARLVTMCEAHLGTCASGTVNLTITQEELAELCNISRKTLNRIFSSLRMAGVLEPKYGSVIIQNLDLLIKIASRGESSFAPDIDIWRTCRWRSRSNAAEAEFLNDQGQPPDGPALLNGQHICSPAKPGAAS